MYGRRRTYKRRYSRRKYRRSTFRRKSAYKKIRVSPYSRSNINKLSYALRNTGKRRPSLSKPKSESFLSKLKRKFAEYAAAHTDEYGASYGHIDRLLQPHVDAMSDNAKRMMVNYIQGHTAGLLNGAVGSMPPPHPPPQIGL